MDGLDASKITTPPWHRISDGIDLALARLRASPVFGYGFAVAFSLLTLAARLGANGLVSPDDYPFLSFLPAVVIVASLAGLGPGIVCATLGGVASWYYFIPPLNTFDINRHTLVGLGFYAFVVTVDLALIHMLTKTARRLSEAQEVTRSLYEQQKTMFQELQHRVANNMTLVASMLELQKRKVVETPETLDGSLDAAIDRIHIMARIHRRLYDPSAGNRTAGDMLGELCGDLIDMAGAGHVTYVVEADPVELDIARMITLALLTAELVTNCLKHAFPGRAAGVVTVRLRAAPGPSVVLEVLDNGRGLPAGDPGPVAGMGRGISERLARQLGGRLVIASDAGGGVGARVSFPR